MNQVSASSGAARLELSFADLRFSSLLQREPPADPLDHATFNIEKIQQNIRSMKKVGEALGSASDTEDLRERLRQGRAVTNGLCKETTQVLRSPVAAQARPKQDKCAV
jgi:hypothetical protein